MKKLNILLALLLFAGLQSTFAQKTITGTIIKANDNTTLSGVTVMLKGTNVSSLSDNEGKYSISVPNENAVLLFSLVGFTRQEITIGGQSILNVFLVESMSEVVITALGIKRESRTLGYAATTINTDDLLINKSANMIESLEGKVSGLNISVPAAGIGSSSQIRLRGQAGFAGANNAPIIVVNGLPMNQDARGANGYGNMRDLGDNLNSLNPDDIESITVLKGATAAAIYGSRAANGAIIITTKTGYKNQGFGIEFSSGYSVQKALNYWELQQIYGQGRNGQKPASQEDAINTAWFGWGARMDGSPVPIFDGTMRPYSPNPNNLFDYYKTGNIQDNTIVFSGGNDKGSFRASFSNMDAGGIDPFNKYKKNIANLGINYNISKKVAFRMNVNYSNEKYINPPEIGTQGPGAVNFFTRLSTSIPFDALKTNATDPATGTEAQIGLPSILNPFYAYQDAGQRFENTRDRYLGTATLRYDITDWLYAQGRINYNYSDYNTESKVPGGIGTNQPLNSDGTYKGRYSLSDGWEKDLNVDFLVGINKKIAKFSVDASLGGNFYTYKNYYFDQTFTNLTERDLFSIANGTIKNHSDGSGKSKTKSLYTLVELGYNSTYYIGFTGRKDRFAEAPTQNSKFYPSVSGSFVFSELLKNAKWLNYTRVRGSWAKVGTEPVFVPGAIILPGTDIYAGTVNEKELGLEAELFKNRMHFDITAFQKVSTNQKLFYVDSNPHINTSGYTSSGKNDGSLKNSGIEFLVELIPIKSNNFRWKTSWNNAYLKTEVLSVGESPDGPIKDLQVIDFNSTSNEFLGQLHYTVGMSMNQLYTKTYLRNENGEILVADNGRLAANWSTDYIPVGSAIPKNTGGWNNSFTYKNLSLGIFIDYKLGGVVMSGTNLNMTRQGFSKLSLEGRRIFTDGTVEDGLIFPGVYQSSGLPNTTKVTDLRYFYGEYRTLQIGDPFVFKSDFVKLRSISLSYDFTDAIKKVSVLSFMKGLTLTASCRNVAILYKDIPNLDPEAIQSSGDFRTGYENAALPTTRNFMFRLSAKF